MAKENSRERIIQLAFGAYPETKEFHFTSDNQAFTEASDAKNHASTLKNKEVELIKRSDIKKSADKDAEDSSGMSSQKDDNSKDKLAAEDERAALVEEYEFLLGKKATHNIGIPKLQAAIDKAKAALKEKEGGESIKHIVTQEDLDANPDLVEQGVKVGDEIEIPGE